MFWVVPFFLFQSALAGDPWKQSHALCALALMRPTYSLDGVQAEHRATAIGRLERLAATLDPFDQVAAKPSDVGAIGVDANPKEKAAVAANAKALIDAIKSPPAGPDHQTLVLTLSGQEATRRWLHGWIDQVDSCVTNIDHRLLGQSENLWPMAPLSSKRFCTDLLISALFGVSVSLGTFIATGDEMLFASLGSQLSLLFFAGSLVDAYTYERRSLLNARPLEALDSMVARFSNPPSRTWMALSWTTYVPLLDIKVAQGEMGASEPLWPPLDSMGPGALPLWAKIFWSRIRSEFPPEEIWANAKLVKRKSLSVNLVLDTTNPDVPELTVVAQVQAARQKPGRPKKRKVKDPVVRQAFLPELAPE